MNSPDSSFSDDGSCSAAVQTLWSETAHLTYYPAGLLGSNNLQSGFVSSSANATNFICTTPSLPTSVSYGLNELNVGVNTVLASLHGDIITQYQGDNNIVVYDTSSGSYVVEWASGHTSSSCSSGTACNCAFQGDGNLVTYVGGVAEWATNTENEGYQLTFLNQSPWIQITNQAGSVVWTTADST